MQGALSLYSPVVQALEQHALPPHAVSGANLLAAAETAGSAGDVATSGRWLMIALELSDAEGDMQMQCLVQLALLRLQLQGPSVQGAPQLHLRPPEENSLLTLELWEKVVDLLEPWQEATLIIEFSLVVIGTAHQVGQGSGMTTRMRTTTDADEVCWGSGDTRGKIKGSGCTFWVAYVAILVSCSLCNVSHMLVDVVNIWSTPAACWYACGFMLCTMHRCLR